ncbi:hypothetical protein C6P41_002935 [Kluyveromyces marxianus]|nr:hypothetical protein C6P41_002935 [Kluyveromyces marxianus]
MEVASEESESEKREVEVEKELASEEIAVEALDKLRNGSSDRSGTGSGSGSVVAGSISGGKSERLLSKMKQSAIELYEQTRTSHPKLMSQADQLVKRIEKTSEKWMNSGKRRRGQGQGDGSWDEEDDSGYSRSDIEESHGLDIEQIRVQDKASEFHPRIRGLKRRRIKQNFKEYQLNLSIESKKRLITCLGLLKLANKQLAQRVTSLQEVVKKEQLRHKPLPASGTGTSASPKDEEEDDKQEADDEDEEFYDASSHLHEPASSSSSHAKVYTVVSRFTGSSLPEPARSQVREVLLKLPTKWLNDSEKPNSKNISSNKRALLLAQEALDMVGNVMNVVDDTLGKAETWVKNKQELKQLLMEQFKHEQLKQKVKHQLTKENNNSSTQGSA